MLVKNMKIFILVNLSYCVKYLRIFEIKQQLCLDVLTNAISLLQITPVSTSNQPSYQNASSHTLIKIVFRENGPKCSSHKFKKSSKFWDFNHKTSSHEFPQGNEFVEKPFKPLRKPYKNADRIIMTILSNVSTIHNQKQLQ